MDSTLAELRAIEQREIAIEQERIALQRRRRELLEVDKGTRKTGRGVITPEMGKMLFAKLAKEAPA